MSAPTPVSASTSAENSSSTTTPATSKPGSWSVLGTLYNAISSVFSVVTWTYGWLFNQDRVDCVTIAAQIAILAVVEDIEKIGLSGNTVDFYENTLFTPFQRWWKNQNRNDLPNIYRTVEIATIHLPPENETRQIFFGNSEKGFSTLANTPSYKGLTSAAIKQFSQQVSGLANKTITVEPMSTEEKALYHTLWKDEDLASFNLWITRAHLYKAEKTKEMRTEKMVRDIAINLQDLAKSIAKRPAQNAIIIG